MGDMVKDNLPNEDEVLRRMLKTPPKSHKAKEGQDDGRKRTGTQSPA